MTGGPTRRAERGDSATSGPREHVIEQRRTLVLRSVPPAVHEEARCLQSGDNLLVTRVLFIDLDEDRGETRILERLGGAPDDPALHAVDVDLDVRGERRIEESDELVDRVGEHALVEGRGGFAAARREAHEAVAGIPDLEIVHRQGTEGRDLAERHAEY